MGVAIPTELATRITSLSIEGFKSIDAELNLELQPLTILAGANSSGKSSALQPLLLLKQTLEASYDPGPLLLTGPNAEFTSVSQFLCSSRHEEEVRSFSIGAEIQKVIQSPEKLRSSFKLFFKKHPRESLELEKQINSYFEPPPAEKWEFKGGTTDLSISQIRDSLPHSVPQHLNNGRDPLLVQTTRTRCFFDAIIQAKYPPEAHEIVFWYSSTISSKMFVDAITRIIHVPGLRGNPKRNYPETAVGDRFPGTFERYVASVVAHAHDGFQWQLEAHLRELGLARKIFAKKVDDAQVELLVNRLPHSDSNSASDLVSIADVGFGVSQTLPVVVALLTAKSGQLVFIEQPEIHLHPRAQVAMASLLARAANRGVQVVIETHSSLLLLGIQRLVADETLDPAKVKLHWFTRNETTGLSNVTSGTLDPAGAFGDWPEDFDDVILSAQQTYLDAAEKKLAP